MSILDSKSSTDSRKNTLGPEAKLPARERIVRKLYKKLEKDNTGQALRQAWLMETARVQEMLDKQMVYLRDLDENLPADSEQPFGGSSNLHIPMPFTVSKTYQARFMQALWGVDPPFTVRARRENGVDKEQLIEDFMRFAIYSWCNHWHGIEDQIEMWVKTWIDTGTGITKVRWQNHWCQYEDSEEVAEAAPPQVVMAPDGTEVLVPQMRIVEKEVNRKYKKFAGPVVDFIQLEDFRMVGGGGDPDLADTVMHRSFVTESELWTMVDEGLFDEEAVERTIRSGENRESSASGKNIATIRAEQSGKASVDSEVDQERFEILECYFKKDVNDSGISSDIVA